MIKPSRTGYFKYSPEGLKHDGNQVFICHAVKVGLHFIQPNLWVTHFALEGQLSVACAALANNKAINFLQKPFATMGSRFPKIVIFELLSIDVASTIKE